MTLILRPPGRGNWRAVVLRVDGDRIDTLFVRVGQRLFLGGHTFRICRVMP